MPSSDDLFEIELIKQLKARYFRHLDTKNWAEWRKVFTDDVIVRIESAARKPGEEAVSAPIQEGGDAFVEETSVALTDVSTVHHGHMPEITLTGPDTATGVWAMEDKVEFPGNRRLHGYGHYHEQYRKVGGAWRVARVHLTRLRVDYFGPWAQSE